jgi:hypothetical protein
MDEYARHYESLLARYMFYDQRFNMNVEGKSDLLLIPPPVDIQFIAIFASFQ